MPHLSITSANAEALQRIADFDQSKFSDLVKSVTADKHPSIRASKLLASVTKFSGDEDFSSALCSQLFSLSGFRRAQGISPSELVEALVEGIKRSGLDEETQIWFNAKQGDFVELLSSDCVRLPAKALHLSTDHSHFFLSANIVTELRPVFDTDREVVEGGVVGQMLRLHYYTDGPSDSAELSLALDLDDIEKLIEELKTAKRKAEIAKEYFQKSDNQDVFLVGEETYGFS